MPCTLVSGHISLTFSNVTCVVTTQQGVLAMNVFLESNSNRSFSHETQITCHSINNEIQQKWILEQFTHSTV